MRGAFIGRFQPFHLGHLHALRYALERVDELIIVIGSAYNSHTFEDPFTAGERVEMIARVLDSLGVRERTFIIPVPDVERNAIWVTHLESLVPKFSVVFSANPLVIRLFKEQGYRVERPPIVNRPPFSATEVRRRMLEGGDWKSLVPDEVAQFIEEIGGVERMREIHE